MIFDIGIKQLSDAGYFSRLDDIRFVDPAVQATGNYAISRKIVEARYLGIVERGWKLSGTVLARSPILSLT